MTDLEKRARQLLKMPVCGEKREELLEGLHVKKKDRDNAMLVAALLLKMAEEGTVTAARELNALAGRSDEEEEKKKADGELAAILRAMKSDA